MTRPNETTMKQALLRSRVLHVAAISLALAACARAPAKLDPPQLRQDAPLAGVNVPTREGWPDADWWRSYGDPQLNELVARSMQRTPDLALAESRVRGAEQSARLAAAQLGLSVNGSAQVSRQRMSDSGLIPSQFLGFSWYNQADLGAQLHYDFDWWGKKRATVEAALDQARVAQAERDAARLTLQYTVADTYFGWQADQARLQWAAQLLTTQQQWLDIAALRVKQGVDLPDEEQKARARIAGVRELQEGLAGSAQIRLIVLASLLGVTPAELPSLQARPLPPVSRGIPADATLDLISRRPDITASRWQVEAALKKTDAARAEYFPDIGITALAGLSSIDLGKVFSGGSRVFGLTPALHLPLFTNGQLEANYGISRAQLDAAIAQYNHTVLSAARDVATQAASAEQIAARRYEKQAEIDAGEKLLATAEARARQGIRDDRERLATRTTLLQSRDAETQLQAQAVSTDLSLIKALGGGYRTDPRSPPTPSTSAGASEHERQ